MEHVQDARCPKCGLKLSHISQLSEKTSKGFCTSCYREVYICNLCGYTTFSRQALAAHLKRHREQKFSIDIQELTEFVDLEDLRLAEKIVVGKKIEEVQVVILALLIKILKSDRTTIDGIKSVRNEGEIEKGEALITEETSYLPSFAKDNPWLKILSKNR